jgi:high affinity sulfate transporter 1
LKTAPSPPERPFLQRNDQRGLAQLFPGLANLRQYSWAYLAKDAVAGCVLTAFLVPAGMGYAQAAGLPAVAGLYATIVPLIVYAIFGPSRLLVMGPDSSLAPLIAAAAIPLAAGSVERAMLLAGALGVLAGLMCIAAGIARLGFVTELLSKPIRQGFMNGIALTVIIGQLPALCGFSVNGDDLLEKAAGFAVGVSQGRVNWMALGIGLTCLSVLLACKRWLPKVPGVLVVVVSATAAVWLFDLIAVANLPVVGPIPRGLPAFRFPAVPIADWSVLVSGAAAIALVAFADMSVLSRTYAQRNGHEVNANQELVALGVANLASGLCQGFPVSSSSSRTPVADSAGARTQVAGVVGAVCIALLVVLAPALTSFLPQAALAAVVVAACLGLFEVFAVVRLFRLRVGEMAVSIACFLGVALLGVIEGIFLSVGLSLLAFVWRAWRPYDAVLGRVDGVKGYHDVSRHPEARRIPGLVIFRWDAPLFFANAAFFADHVQRAVDGSPTPVKWVVVAAEPVTDIDITAADMLAELDGKMSKAGIKLCFAELKGPVKDHLKRYGLFQSLGSGSFFPTLGQAVDQYLAINKVPWVDWEDQK